jgi:hypothetical protein
MSKWFLTRLLQVAFLSVLFLNPAHSQTAQPKRRIMFYNVENLFDTNDDSLTDDNDFLPDGMMRWNHSRYHKKINSLYKTIISAGEWEPPLIVALCEIENKNVLEDLIYDTYLSKFNYGIIHEDSPDRRGIDVCLIFRKGLVDIVHHCYWIPGGKQNKSYNSRSILYAKALIGGDTIHLIVNHWPSRRGGVLAGEENRNEIADLIDDKIDSINQRNLYGSKILIMGDFNCTPEDPVIKNMLLSADKGDTLVNLSEIVALHDLGTYRYQGSWEMIDQLIVSKQLLRSSSGLYTEPDLLRIFKPDFLLKKDPKYPGLTPYSTFRGYKYQGGFSDHLPILLDLKVR